MKIIGNSIEFFTADPIFALEASGDKPNTERLLNSEEEMELLEWLGIYGVAWVEKEEEKLIMIKSTDSKFTLGEYTLHRLTSVVKVGALLGRSLWVFSWNPEEV
jgi:hypothetical protein